MGRGKDDESNADGVGGRCEESTADGSACLLHGGRGSPHPNHAHCTSYCILYLLIKQVGPLVAICNFLKLKELEISGPFYSRYALLRACIKLALLRVYVTKLPGTRNVGARERKIRYACPSL